MCNRGTKAGCLTPIMYARSLEMLVWNAVSDFVSRPEQVKDLLAARQSDVDSGRTLENVVKGRERLYRMEAVQSWMASAQHIAVRLNTLTDAERAEVVKLLVDRVAVDGQDIKMRMVFDFRESPTSSPRR